MSDFNSISYTRYIPITNIGIHAASTLFIEGKDVSSTNIVFINGVSTREFIIVSKTRLLVDIPASEISKPISTATLAGTNGNVGFLNFSVKNNTKITDSRYVVQRFFRHLLMSPGSDVFNLNTGTGLLDTMGTVGFEDAELYVTAAIKQTEDYVIQTQKPELPDSKTLNMVNILNVSYSISTLTTSVSLQFLLADGSTVDTNFNLAG